MKVPGWGSAVLIIIFFRVRFVLASVELDNEDAVDYIIERYDRPNDADNDNGGMSWESFGTPTKYDNNWALMMAKLSSEKEPNLSAGAGMNHPCQRKCSTDPSQMMTCQYKFVLEHMMVMSTACGRCPLEQGDCTLKACVHADGVRRLIDTVNRMMPGPSIRVCEGDTIIVDVFNGLMQDTTIHWHGIHMKKTPFMDGVPMTTQCPISRHQSFRYEFDVPIGGTYFWHSHAGVQRGDGLYGTLIVRKPEEKEPYGPSNGNLYDFDLPEHEMVVMDWQRRSNLDVFIGHQFSNEDFRPNNVLVNGKGWPRNLFSQTAAEIEAGMRFPLQEIRIQKDFGYRLRLITNGISGCPLKMSIENHTMQVISSDGFDIAPVTVDSLVLYAGERWDVVIQGDQPIGSYWIKFKGLGVCASITSKAFQVAILNYEGIDPGTTPSHFIKNWEESAPPPEGKQLNPLNYGPGVRGHNVTVAQLYNVHDDDPDIIRNMPDYKFVLSYDFNRIDNIKFDPNNPHKASHVANIGGKLYTPQINYLSHVMPSSPPLSQPETIPYQKFCSNLNGTYEVNGVQQSKDCSHEYCTCTHLIKVKLGSIVEIILIDKGETVNANHPFHLHGHSFRVVGLERLGTSTTIEKVEELDKKHLLIRRRSNAPIKDTVTVPDGGYTVLRFRADNPGFWYFHCHIEFHAEVGMGLIFQVGEVNEMLKPASFTRCGNTDVTTVTSTTSTTSTRTRRPRPRKTRTRRPRTRKTRTTTTTTTKKPDDQYDQACTASSCDFLNLTTSRHYNDRNTMVTDYINANDVECSQVYTDNPLGWRNVCPYDNERNIVEHCYPTRSCQVESSG